ncbi:RNA polymerase sigma factor [Pseudobacter ginsenosidimutans]|uniref:RNA polymerase sigma-70 factor (Family 1) n=1 Tax=Pseudobacter ginsenosidimutans TaxID=661488 RepID=A0A4Q7N0H8_9BACT|nr:sigma-70 family RNA polymerase sigma factor [Pseudobacter ginsenosidimutans]RZS75080.1 RNA polymerase sigma-70 factor (family 1) [Pseudobacter ginsenosidimutans]
MESKDQNAELLNALKTTDRRKGVELVFKQYYSEMVDYAWNITGARKLAEDVVMEVFLRLLQKEFNFENINNLKAYLMITVRNSCFATLESEEKRQKRQQEAESSISNLESLDLDRIDASVTHLIYSEIESLPARARTIFILKTFNRFSYDEIAERMGISSKTAKNQYFIALAKLRTSFLKRNIVLHLLVSLSGFLHHFLLLITGSTHLFIK